MRPGRHRNIEWQRFRVHLDSISTIDFTIPAKRHVGFEWFVRRDQNVEAEARNGGLAIQIENPAPERAGV